MTVSTGGPPSKCIPHCVVLIIADLRSIQHDAVIGANSHQLSETTNPLPARVRVTERAPPVP